MRNNIHKNKNNPLRSPKHTNIPFFAYGIFKPGQIAYSRIKSYVRNKYDSEIDYKMLMRDGVPLIVPSRSNNHSKTKGYLIYFNEENSKEAYDIISKTHYKRLYKWEEIEVGEKNKANVLMGVNPEMGSHPIEINKENYDGQYDPYFKEAIEVVENELNNNNKHSKDLNTFFRLQMSYLLLWTAIERYCSLKYDKTGSKINQLSKDNLFKKSLKKHAPSKRNVYSAEDLKNYTLNSEEPYDSIRYYYTVRCNVAHRGKAAYNDNDKVRYSLKELLEIFKDIIENSFEL